MAFSSGDSGGPMVDMNIIPLCDVLLVLLIIFMVTMPQPSHPIDIDLPQRVRDQPPPQVEPPPPIRLRIDDVGQIFWDNSPAPLSSLLEMMKAEVEDRELPLQPTLEIDTSEEADYEVLAKVLAIAKNAQMKKIGFVRK